MRAALVSATSLAALLAFEVGLDVAMDARPALASAFTAGTALDFGNNIYVLVGTTATALETVTNGITGKNTITLPGVSSTYFSGAGSVVTVTGSGATAAVAYTFAPLSSGGWTNTFSIKSGTNTATVVETGAGVAPFQSTTVSAFGAVRIGTTATIAAITVANVGDGDLAPGGNTLSMAQLRGSIGAPSGSVFTGSGGTFSLNDQFYSGSGTATTSAAYTYRYAPTAHTTSDTATVVANFADGSTSGTNAAQTATLTLSGSGVGPEFQSKVGSTTYSNTTAIGNTTVAAGTISTGAYTTSTTTSLQVTLSNISTDAGSASLTDLTLENFALSGASASDFSVVGFTTNTVLAEAQSVVVTLDFSGPTVGNYTADLNFTTDEGAALGGAGAVFSYTLSAKIPEPATIVMFGMGLAGLGWVRRRRGRRVSAVWAQA